MRVNKNAHFFSEGKNFMPKIIKRLTDNQIKNSRVKDKNLYLRDGNGLVLIVRKNNIKNWAFKYISPTTNRENSMSLGSYPSVSLDEARSKRDEYIKLLKQKIDPQIYRNSEQQKQLDKQRTTFKYVMNEWYNSSYCKKLKPRTLLKKRQSLEKHIVPFIGNVPIQEITPSMVIELLKPLEQENKFETLYRIIQRINEIMDYSINLGYIDTNKLNKVHMIFESHQANHMLSIRPEELPEFMKALSKAQIKPYTKLLIEFQLLTLARPIEAVQVEWNEIDFDKRIWTVPKEKIKKNREHLVPLSQRAIDILLEMKKINGSRKYVFTSQVKKHLNNHMNSQTANGAIKRMGYGGKLVAHGLRSVASTYLNEQNFDKEIIEIALSHIDKNTVRRAYNRSLYLEQRTEMLNCWAEFVRFAKIGKVLQFNKQKSTNPKSTVNFTSNYSNTSNMSKISYSMNLTA